MDNLIRCLLILFLVEWTVLPVVLIIMIGMQSKHERERKQKREPWRQSLDYGDEDDDGDED